MMAQYFVKMQDKSDKGYTNPMTKFHQLTKVFYKERKITIPQAFLLSDIDITTAAIHNSTDFL